MTVYEQYCVYSFKVKLSNYISSNYVGKPLTRDNIERLAQEANYLLKEFCQSHNLTCDQEIIIGYCKEKNGIEISTSLYEDLILNQIPNTPQVIDKEEFNRGLSREELN